MALFESYERREPQILAVLKEYGISSIEECKEITEAAGIDVYHLIAAVQQMQLQPSALACRHSAFRVPLLTAAR